jgi:ATP-dependent Clp protease ATP-binding subunit ClpC
VVARLSLRWDDLGLFERFTEPARQVVVRAQEEARQLRHEYIGAEHLLLGLFADENRVAVWALKALNLTADRIRDELVELRPPEGDGRQGHIPFTPQGKRMLENSVLDARHHGSQHVDPENILLALIGEPDGVAATILTKLDVTPKAISETVEDMLAVGPRELHHIQPSP